MRTHFTLSAALVTIVATTLSVGCDDGEPPSYEEAETRLCAAVEARDERCNPFPEETPRPCWLDRYPDTTFDPSYLDRYAACVEGDQLCEKGDACATEALGVDLETDPDIQSCTARQGACDGSFADDYCFTLQGLTTSVRAEVDACLEGPCDAIERCIENATGQMEVPSTP